MAASRHAHPGESVAPGSSIVRIPSEPGRRILGFIEQNEERFQRTPDFAAFYEALAGVEMERVGRLFGAIEDVDAGRLARAAREAEALIAAPPRGGDGGHRLAARTFADAVLARARGEDAGGGNLYLGARPPGVQLRAFELLRLRTPLIPFGYASANRALLEAVEERAGGEGRTAVTLIDIGAGQGGQIRSLLRNPAARRLLGPLEVIAVEPDASAATGSGALQRAEESVLATAAELGLDVTFRGIAKRAEDLTPDDLRPASPRSLVLCNCAFVLHHVAAGAGEERTRVLRTLRDAGVDALVLVEPDSNHHDDDLRSRFLYAYRHYRVLAQSLHALLAPADADLVWAEFFAPEVRNVVSHEGARRVERHEEIVRWKERLEQAGFAVDPLCDVLPRAAAPAGFAVCAAADAFTLRYEGVSLLGVLRARPVT
jgi:hypothetical protein